MILPFIVKKQLPAADKSPSVIALDPGVRIFQTGYDNTGNILECGKKQFTRFVSFSSKADHVQSKLDSSECSYLRKSQYEDAKEKRKYKNMRRKARKIILPQLFNRIKHLKQDAHRCIAKDLCSSYSHILIPRFEVSNMVLRGRRKIRSQTVRSMLHWSHFHFRQQLKQKAELMGYQVTEVSEYYTSKACGSCGYLDNALGGKEVYKCK
jgi:putative transposase